MSEVVPETQEDPVLGMGWGTDMSVPVDSPCASIAAGIPVSARALGSVGSDNSVTPNHLLGLVSRKDCWHKT